MSDSFSASKIADLKENEVAGYQTINAILRFLRNIKSGSEDLTVNSNPEGGITIETVPTDSNASKIEDFDFQVTDYSTNNNGQIVSVTLAGGYVVCPTYDYYVSGRQVSVSAGTCVYVEVTTSGASIMAGARPSFVDLTNRVVNVPLVTISTDGKKYRYNHMGSVEWANTPFVHVSGYAQTEQYSRDILDGQEVYTPYDQCDDDREQEL